MTFDECRRELDSLRSKQGTPRPLIRVDYGGASYKGLLAHSDCDEFAIATIAPAYGVLVIEEPGLTHMPQTLLQIASIQPGGISDPSDN